MTSVVEAQRKNRGQKARARTRQQDSGTAGGLRELLLARAERTRRLDVTLSQSRMQDEGPVPGTPGPPSSFLGRSRPTVRGYRPYPGLFKERGLPARGFYFLTPRLKS